MTRFRSLGSFAHTYAAMVHLVEAMPDDALRELIEEAEATTNTNCPWNEYRVAQLLLPYAKRALKRQEESAARFSS